MPLRADGGQVKPAAHRVSIFVACATLLASTSLGCTGVLGSANGTSDGTGANSGEATGCDLIPTRVTRLSDRQLANWVRDLLSLDAPPELRTSSGTLESFLPNKAAAVSGGVALSLRDVAESVSATATAAGSRLLACTGDERACASTFLDKFAARAFRRRLEPDERTDLLAVYDSGRANYGGHAGGLRLVIEAVLQSPSFVYLRELGTAGEEGRVRLTGEELAAKLSLFLLDGAPDDSLWDATLAGHLETEEGVDAEVKRLLEKPEVKANVTKMFSRLFQLDRIFSISKDASVTDFTPALASALYEGTERFLDDAVWSSGGTLETLFTSHNAFMDKATANLYGVSHSDAPGFEKVTLPATERAGILTQPSLLTMEALPSESSVVHRGVFIARELLCFQPPPPTPDDLRAGDALKKQEPTERGRAEKRREVSRCAGCHAYFDPFGITFENYDTLGKYRTTIETTAGQVPVDASYEMNVFDVKGAVSNGVQLSSALAKSEAVQSCMVRQLTSYAIGQRLTDAQMCNVTSVVEKFKASSGNLVELVKAVALWNGLRERGGAQ